MSETHPPTRGANTSEILRYFEHEENILTRASLRQILGNRIDEGRKALRILTDKRYRKRLEDKGVKILEDFNT